MSNPADEIRSLIKKMNESFMSVIEDDKKIDDEKDDEKENPAIDSVLTSPHGIEKIEVPVNVQELINLLEIPKDIEPDFRSAMNIIRHSDNPVLIKPQALALAFAFERVLLLNTDKRQKFISKIGTTESSSNQGS